MRKGVVTEAVVVGGSLLAVSAATMFVARRVGVADKVPLPAWIFLAGALTHFGWEATGGNKWFAENYPKSLKGLDLGEAMKRAEATRIAGRR